MKARSNSMPQPLERASEHDREYMRSLGRWKHESHAEVLAEHLRLGGRARLEAAVAMMLAGPYFDRPSRDDDHPEALFERAKRLGLYRS
jgi:hypothetical protein